MDKKSKRNIIGSGVAFTLSLLFSGIGIIIMIAREFWQSYRYGFDIEHDDILRYSIWGSIGCLINSAIILSFAL